MNAMQVKRAKRVFRGKYRYLRFAFWLITLLPLPIFLLLFQFNQAFYRAVQEKEFLNYWIGLGYVAFIIAVPLVESLIENALERKCGKKSKMKNVVIENITIGGTELHVSEMSEEQKNLFDAAFKEFDKIFENIDDDKQF